MDICETEELTPKQKGEILDLWNTEYPAKLCYTTLNDFEKYLSGLGEAQHFLLVDDSEAVKGWFVGFVREDAKWFAMILSSTVQGRGYGSKLLSNAKELATELNGWVIDHDNDKKRNGDSYISPVTFYKKNGFEVIGTTRLELDIISAVKIRWRK